MKIPNKNKNKTKTAFSLPEILIALIFIGVVVALTMPVVTGNVNDNELKSKWQKEYALVSSILSYVRKEYGDFSYCLGNRYCLENIIKTKLKINTDPDAFPSLDFNYRDLSGTDLTTDLFDDGIFNSISGATYFFENSASITTPPLIIWVDVNGINSKPNIIGKDMFGVFVYNDYWTPIGSVDTGADNTCNSNNFTLAPVSDSTPCAGCGCSYEYIIN